MAMSAPPESTSRYELLEKVAAGGMATVYVGRQRGAEGFWRLVAIKRPHQHLLDDPAFRRMFVEEARLASRIHHPHVVPVLDVEERTLGQLLLVMDYIEGASLAELMDEASARGASIPPRVAVRITLDALAGLHAAHELTDAAGRPLRLVHRDVSPHNILVGVDGTSRVADFGIAKSVVSKGVTESGVLKGKLAYMAPEYVTRQLCDPRSDVFAMAVVTWEALAGQRLFRGESDYDTLRKIVDEAAPPLSMATSQVGTALDEVLAAALERDTSRRTPTARAFAEALEAAARRMDLVATTGEVGDYLRSAMATPLGVRRERLRRFLDAGGTTGPMVSAEASASSAGAPSGPRDSGGGREAQAPSAVSTLEVEEAPISVGVTSVGGAEATERALVAAGLRPRRRSSWTFLVAAVAVTLGAASAFWWFGAPGLDAPSGPTTSDGAALHAAEGAPTPLAGAGEASPAPKVAPLASTDPTAIPTTEASAAGAPPPTPSAPPRSGAAASGSKPAPSARAVPAPPAPPPSAPPTASATGPIRQNPYR